MGTFNLEINIDRPPADVFVFVGNPTTMPSWYDAVERVTDIPPPDLGQERVTRSSDHCPEAPHTTRSKSRSTSPTADSRSRAAPVRPHFATATTFNQAQTERPSRSRERSAVPACPDPQRTSTPSRPSCSSVAWRKTSTNSSAWSRTRPFALSNSRTEHRGRSPLSDLGTTHVQPQERERGPVGHGRQIK